MKNIKLFIYTSLALGILGSGKPALAKPILLPTALPVPQEALDEERDEAMVMEVLKLRVYPDSDDKKQYYYMPPFHIRQYSIGAATMIVFDEPIQMLKEARAAMKEKEDYSNKALVEMKLDLEKYEQKLDNKKDKLSEAMEKGNPQVIKFWETEVIKAEANLADNLREYNRVKAIVDSGGSILPEGFRKQYNRIAISRLAQSGIDIAYSDDLSSTDMERKIDQAIEEMSNSEAGYLTVNIYGGFTEKQLTALQTYRAKYASDIKISLMPVENIDFFSLAGGSNVGKDGRATGSRFFGKINGSGDYLGAAITISTSVAAGEALLAHMGPFVLPMGIEANIKHKANPIDMHLDCNFTDFLEISGERNIRNSDIVFNINQSSGVGRPDKDIKNDFCSIIINSGDRASAEYAALKELETYWLARGAELTLLSTKEREMYIQARETALNRPFVHRQFDQWSDLKGNKWLARSAQAVSGTLPELFMQSDIYNVTKMSEWRFSKNIILNGDETKREKLPVNLCLVYNPLRKAYDRCTDVEEVSATTMQQALEDSAGADICAGLDNPKACGELRDELGLLPKVNRKFTADGALVRSI